MIYKCFKNWHWFIPILPLIYLFRKRWVYNISFKEGYSYNLDGIDQLDYNKLCGIANTINPRKQSIRIGWRWNLNTQAIEVAVMIENNYKFNFYLETSVSPNTKIILEKQGDKALISIDGKQQLFDFKINNICFRALPYFGGNKKAPNSVTISIK